MAGGAHIHFAGRFKPGTDVDIYEVAGAHVLRAEGGTKLGSATSSEDGVVEFSDGIVEGGRYRITGYINGRYEDFPVRGTASDEVSQTPVQPDRMKLADGSWADERPEKRDVPPAFVGPGIAQEQVPEGTSQRVDTGRGEGFPVGPEEQVPSPRAEEAEGPQMVQGDTGEAFPAKPGISRQEDAQDIPQRVVAQTGQAFPIPKGDAVDAFQMRDSSDAKVMRGGPTGAMTSPLGIEGPDHSDPEDKPEGLVAAQEAAVEETPAEEPEEKPKPRRRTTPRRTTRAKK